MPKRHATSQRRSRPPLGQVFLTDRRVESRILDVLRLTPDDVVLEIGAGPGNMTALLASHAARVIALDVDPELVSRLRRKFEANSNVEIREADILKFPIDKLVQDRLVNDTLVQQTGRAKIKVFGNLPYYITSPCLMHLFRHHAVIEEIVVMVQEEVACRIVAKPGTADYGLLSLTCQYYTHPALLFSVGPKSFTPPPQVRSAVVRMPVAPQRDALGIRDEAAFWKLVRAAFAQKRKTLFNNLKTTWDEHGLREAMRKAGVEPRARAEILSLDDFAALFKALHGGN